MPADPLWPSILILLVLLILYALCTACQTAIASIREAGKSRLSEEDGKAAQLVAHITDDPELFQSGTHLITMAAETVWFVYGVCALYARFPLSPAASVTVTAVILGVVLWFVGRMLPRRIAILRPEAVALKLCPLFRPLVILMTPLSALFLLLSKGVLRLLHIAPPQEDEDVFEDEIMAMVESGEESGVIQTQEKELIENVFEFDNMTAEDVMIHRTDVELLYLEDSDEEVMETITQTGFSRFPVCGENADDVVGVLNVRDYLINRLRPTPIPRRELLRPAYFVPESVPTDVLFRDMQKGAIQMAIVVDEYGGTSGIVTLEDLLEELVGNIYDEFDTKEEQEIIPLGKNLWRIAGSAEMETVVETLGLELKEEDEEELSDTLGGLVFSCLSVIPDDGATPTVSALGLRIQVESLSDRRVEWALVSLETPPTEISETEH